MPNMLISRAPQNVSAWLTESNLMPPKDPHDDDDENERDEEDDDDEDEDDEPAVIREPNE